METEESGRDDSSRIPLGTPRWIIPALTIAFAAIAPILLVIAATNTDGGAVVNVLSLVSGLMSLVVTVRMARLWRQQRKGPRNQPGRHHFQNEEQWITALSPQDAVDALVRVFGQPGLTTKVTGSDVWVEISSEWQGQWRHHDAARHLKVRPHIRFVVDATDNGTRVTAFSREFQLGMYDVLKLADEMSESGVALARQVTGTPA